MRIDYWCRCHGDNIWLYLIGCLVISEYWWLPVGSTVPYYCWHSLAILIGQWKAQSREYQHHSLHRHCSTRCHVSNPWQICTLNTFFTSKVDMDTRRTRSKYKLFIHANTTCPSPPKVDIDTRRSHWNIIYLFIQQRIINTTYGSLHNQKSGSHSLAS